MKVALALAVVGTLARVAAGDNSAPPPARAAAVALAELRFETTPGKPMELARSGEPAERIVARRDGARWKLVVSRNVGKQYEEGTAQLGEADWRALEALVAQQALLAWRPKPTREQGADYSTSRFAIRGADGQVANEQRWSRPIENGAPAWALGQALAALARARVKTPALYYLVP